MSLKNNAIYLFFFFNWADENANRTKARRDSNVVSKRQYGVLRSQRYFTFAFILLIFQIYLTIIASWSQVTNRRKFFESYANEYNFDPLVVDNWYSQPLSKLMSYKVPSFFIVSF